MDYLYYSVILFNLATYGYLAASMLLILYLVKPEWVALERIFKGVGSAIVAAHTLALLSRWLQAGFDRPPWTNLYESLIFFTWGLGLVSTVIIIRNRAFYLGSFLYPLAFAGLGLAALVPDKSITPLVPALQSYWIKIHVVMATFAYPGFIVAGLISLFYLFKSKTAVAKLNIGFAIFALFCLVVVGRGDVFLHGQYQIPVMELVEGRWYKIPIDPSAKTLEWQMGVVSGASVAMLLTALTYLISLIYAIAAWRTQNDSWSRLSTQFFRVATLFFAGLIGVVYYQIAVRPEFTQMSNTYEMAILDLAWLICVFYGTTTFGSSWLASRLPPAERLDEFAYKVTLFAFPFMTLLLITGAIWAYSAWGRYWGWDPKETCALVTWLIFAAYLHSRRYFGASGRPSAVISLIGAVSVFFTFLGANLVLSGLHSYGAQ